MRSQVDAEETEDAAVGEPGEDHPEAERSETETLEAAEPRGRPAVPLWAQLALLAAALVVLGTGSLSWWQAEHDDALAMAERRDAVLIAARRNIEVMNSMDYRSVGKGVQRWEDVTTGVLHDQIVGITGEERKLVVQQKKIATARVVDAAVIDLENDSASVIAAVEVTVRDGAEKESEPSVKRNRFSADLVRVDGDWLLEKLQQVAVSLS